jgi:hypothetical protein
MIGQPQPVPLERVEFKPARRSALPSSSKVERGCRGALERSRRCRRNLAWWPAEHDFSIGDIEKLVDWKSCGRPGSVRRGPMHRAARGLLRELMTVEFPAMKSAARATAVRRGQSQTD